MASLIIRRLDDRTKSRLRIRAAHNGRSMEEEAREILRSTLTTVPPAIHVGQAIHQRFAALGGFDLEPANRDGIRPAPSFEK
jgi:plasmid stability protein